MNRIPGNVTPTPMSRVLRATPLILNERGNIPMNSKANPQTETPHSTQKFEPLREKGEPLTCSLYKQSGGSSRFSALCVVSI